MSSVEMEKQMEEENHWPTFESGSESQVPLNLTTVRTAIKQETETESVPEVTCPEQNHVIGIPASRVLSPSRKYRRNSESPTPDFVADAKNLSGMSMVQNTGPHLEYGGYYSPLPPGIGMNTPGEAMQFIPSTAPPPPPPFPSIISSTTEASEYNRLLRRLTAFVALYLGLFLSMVVNYSHRLFAQNAVF